ncbi:hypothetical protein EXIGLDRAFT_764848 [Exidia glandulosa HHB12029]|uniref:F-box domain-containing protein n=1 Tax=Exidia glandulosa HHB12029 TaxID=1314781 RepID=A0A165KV34_EXIGL|nr:hypothetical protein EXIGLDRAFT_764848 [Exidia glandulosa HHB12029]
MTFSNRDVLNRRVEADRAEQDRLAALLHNARVSLSVDAAALSDAQARFNDSNTVVTRLAERFATLDKSIAISRLSLLRSVMDSVPDDVLRLVFRQVVNTPDRKWPIFGVGVFSKERAQAPFTISAVCRKWRRTACDNSGLWTYLGVPPLACRDGPWPLQVHLDRVNLLVARSKTSDVDVLIDWSGCTFDLECTTPMEGILTQLFRQSLRWRRVEISLPMHTDRATLSVLRGPTPNLEQLSLVCPGDNEWDATAQSGFLPYAPRLHELELSGSGIFPRPFTDFPSLCALRLWDGSRSSLARTFIFGAQQTLESLLICTDRLDVTAPITLPHLTSLTVEMRLFVAPSLLVAPCLSKLVLHSNCIGPEIVTFFSGIVETATHLTLVGTVNANLLDVLSGLRNLTHFRVMVCFNLDHSTVLEDSFWERLADAEPHIWPKLTHLRVETWVNVNPPDGHGITHLLAARNNHGKSAIDTSDSHEDRPSPLKHVTLDYNGVPYWVTAEVSRLLATASPP